MRVAILGTGSAGRRHARNLEARGCEVVAVGGGETPPVDVDAVVVATPTDAHLRGLAWAVEHGVHAYVEKPLAPALAGARELLERADAARLVVASGYNLRFHPALATIRAAVADGLIGRVLTARLEVGQFLPDWHPDEDYRRSYAARADGGGGALLTLSHELDLARWIGGEVVGCRGTVRRLSRLELDVDDVAEVVCEHEGGAVTSVHADFLDRSYNRRSRWVGESATLVWSWGGDVVLLPQREVLWRDTGFDPEATYVLALEDFLDAVQTRRRPLCDGWDGLRVVELCEEARR